jgi:hypothetical protein
MSSLLLFSAVRKRLSRWIDIDVSSTVHLTALSLSLYLLAWSLLNVAWMGGIEGLREEAETVSVVMLLLQSAVLVLVAFLGVGMGTRRSMREVVERLGLHRLEWVHLLIAGVTLVIMVVLNFVVAGLWMLLAPEQVEAISQISQSMLGNFDSVPAIILLAVLSGFSEEVLFRGALQPRMGLFLTSLLFAGTHVQYSISPATLLVLVIGIVLGILRRFFGTWTSIITHFGYNLSLLLLGMLGSRLLEVLG